MYAMGIPKCNPFRWRSRLRPKNLETPNKSQICQRHLCHQPFLRRSSNLHSLANETMARRPEGAKFQGSDVSPRCADLPDATDRLALLTIVSTRCSLLCTILQYFSPQRLSAALISLRSLDTCRPCNHLRLPLCFHVLSVYCGNSLLKHRFAPRKPRRSQNNPHKFVIS